MRGVDKKVGIGHELNFTRKQASRRSASLREVGLRNASINRSASDHVTTPAVPQPTHRETKDRASDLLADLEAQLTSQQVEAGQVRVQTKTFEAFVDEVLKQV